MSRLSTIALLAVLGAVVPALAQQNQGGDLSQERGQPGSQEGGPGAHTPQAAQAGANTTAGTTTGSSGPDAGKGGPPSTEPPPLPAAGLCDDVRDTPMHAPCLAVVLRQDTPGGAQ